MEFEKPQPKRYVSALLERDLATGGLRETRDALLGITELLLSRTWSMSPLSEIFATTESSCHGTNTAKSHCTNILWL